jgi:hypothetical protein
MSDKVVQFYFGQVTFFRNRRSKSIKLSIRPDKRILVSFPWHVSEKEAIRFVHSHEGWINEKLDKLEKKIKKIAPGTIINTKIFAVTLIEGDKNQLRVSGKTANLFVRDFDSEESRNFIGNALDHIYRYEAKKLLPLRLAELAVKHGFSYKSLTIRNNRRNWGSCSSRNTISLNLQMMKLPDELIDYILLHELVHTKIKNHGPEFWTALNYLTDNRAKQLALEVRKHSTFNL